VIHKLVRYAADKNICIHLLLIPIKAYTVPVIIRMTPATDKAGVMAGVSGSVVLSSLAVSSAVIFVLADTVAEGMTDVAKVDGVWLEAGFVEVERVAEGSVEAGICVGLPFCVELGVKVSDGVGEEAETGTEELPS